MGQAGQAGANAADFTVSELSAAIKRTLEDGFGYIRLRGEISGYRGPHASGHCYFALKDQRARIEAVIWRGVFSRLKVKPEEGMEVIATGKVSSYPGSSKYQIVIDALEPAGLGAMMAELEERKKRLTAEGLFADERKQKLPFLPETVGVITSPTGAVIRDILAGFTERFPTRVIIWPVKVQGEGSASDVARAIAGMNALSGSPIPKPDVLIVARGGGSLEDLWSFNDEAVVRVAAASSIPLVAAVGHETDWTLIDLVADARAPTPTKAAEWTVPKFADLVTELRDRETRLRQAMMRQLQTERTNLKAAARGLPKPDDLVTLARQRFDMMEHRLSQALIGFTAVLQNKLSTTGSRLNPTNLRQKIGYAQQTLNTNSARMHRALSGLVITRRQTVNHHAKLLNSLGYRNVLGRGYALVRDNAGAPIRHARSIHDGQDLTLEFVDGQTGAIAKAGRSTPQSDHGAQTKPGAQKKPRSSATKKRAGGDQGTLF